MYAFAAAPEYRAPCLTPKPIVPPEIALQAEVSAKLEEERQTQRGVTERLASLDAAAAIGQNVRNLH